MTYFEKLTEAKDACYARWWQTRTPGSDALFKAVWDLWNYTPAGPFVFEIRR